MFQPAHDLVFAANFVKINAMQQRVFLFLLLGLLWAWPAGADCGLAVQYGQIEARKAASGYILAAPHGLFDKYTDQIAGALCQQLGWNCLIARGQRRARHPINVNRPTEGVHLSSDQEQHTQRARQVYACYRETLHQLKTSHFRLYVELHGNARSESQHQIEIATPGLSLLQKQQVAEIFSRALQQQGLSPRLRVAVQGLEKIYFTHGSARKFGVFAEMRPVLALEIPRWVRQEPAARKSLIAALAQGFHEMEQAGVF